MRGVWSVFKRELGGYFATPLASIVIVVFLVLAGVFTFLVSRLYEGGQADLAGFFGWHPWLYLFLIPAVAMRLWAEEKRSGTIELLMTLPITAAGAVAGKFLAAWTFTGLALALTFPVWITVNVLGDPDNGTIVAAYIGSALMAGGFLAIGSLVSACTRSQVIAFVVSVVVCLGFLLAGHDPVVQVIRGWAPAAVVDTIAGFSFLTNFEWISKGVIDLRHVVFFASLIGVCLAMNTAVLSARDKAWGAVAVLAVLFLGVNMLAGSITRSVRLDLTEGRLYTLSQGARNVAKLPDEPITLTFFYTPDAATGLAREQAYARRVRETLGEFAAASAGKIKLNVVNPEPFSDAEDRATEAGLLGLPTRTGQQLYLGLVGTNAVDGKEVIPFLDPESAGMLEYDLSRLIYSLANPKRRVVGYISSLPIEGVVLDPMTGMPLARNRQIPPWAIVSEMQGVFDVRRIGPTDAELPKDLDVLVLIHPKGLTEAMLWEIDQYVMKGGKLLAFLDPLCESDIPPGADRNPLSMLQADRSSSIGELARAWGIEIDKEKIVGDLGSAMQVQTSADPNAQPLTFPAWMNLESERMTSSDPITARLRTLIVPTAGAIVSKPDGLTVTPLVRTSTSAGFINAGELRFMPDPKQVLQNFKPGSEALTIAARLTGKARSAFPNGRPAAPVAPDQPNPPAQPPAQGLKESVGDVNIIVVADADLLADRFWTREERFLGSSLGRRKMADNGDLLINAIDNLSGSGDLIAIRPRATFNRPFTRVQKIAKAAEEKFLAEQQSLEDKIRQTSERISQLQQARPEEKALILSPEQQAEVEKLRAELRSSRQRLREVQFSLRRDIEALGARLKIINIGAAPLAVVAAAIGAGLVRAGRRRRP